MARDLRETAALYMLPNGHVSARELGFNPVCETDAIRALCVLRNCLDLADRATRTEQVACRPTDLVLNDNLSAGWQHKVWIDERLVSHA